ncbi:DUF2786 domain-containing protein [Vreelandella alkaliphila]|uniref:DUF2786 domain-containing protein n=1 Tax=Halomonadaceae TaxID=28256 RepID=UPI003F91EB78
MTTTDRILDKIQKCMNLSKSDNVAEAAAALRQAQKLMEKHNLTASDLSLNTVTQAVARCATKALNPAPWVHYLRKIVADAFGVDVLNQSKKLRGVYYNHAVFIGVGDKANVAQYCYEVLFRQITRDRETYKKELDGRLSNRSKTRRCDLFCTSWARSVSDKVNVIAMTEEDSSLVTRFMSKTYPSLKADKLRTVPRAQNEADVRAIQAGQEAGQKAQLFKGVGVKAPAKALA